MCYAGAGCLGVSIRRSGGSSGFRIYWLRTAFGMSSTFLFSGQTLRLCSCLFSAGGIRNSQHIPGIGRCVSAVHIPSQSSSRAGGGKRGIRARKRTIALSLVVVLLCLLACALAVAVCCGSLYPDLGVQETLSLRYLSSVLEMFDMRSWLAR
jgi:hypothetical protein